MLPVRLCTEVVLFQVFAVSITDIDEIILISSRVEQRASQSFNLTCWKSRQPRVYNLLSIFRQMSLSFCNSFDYAVHLTYCVSFLQFDKLVDSIV